MGAAPAKYLFDNDFAGGGERKPSIPLSEHAQKLKEAETTGHNRGRAEAKTEAEARTAAALERIASALTAIDGSLTAIEARLETEAIEVAVAVASKLAPALLAREPFAEIAALATDCFRHLVACPHVVVRVNDALQGVARQELDEIIRRQGLESRLVILAEPHIPPGDCRIEWADGGIVRDSAAAAAAIDEAVARYIGARTAATSASETSGRK